MFIQDNPEFFAENLLPANTWPYSISSSV